jgi:hypothetical protein
LLDQVCRDHAVDNARHPAHDLGPAGKQKAQLKESSIPIGAWAARATPRRPTEPRSRPCAVPRNWDRALFDCS